MLVWPRPGASWLGRPRPLGWLGVLLEWLREACGQTLPETARVLAGLPTVLAEEPHERSQK